MKPIPRMNISNTSLLILVISMSAVISPPATAAAWSLSDLFPMVNVTITNNATHEVWYMCNNKEGRLHDELFRLGRGDVTQWAIRDIGFPLVWCYMHINDGIQGVFWAFLTKYRCDRHCDWWVKDDGLYLHTRFDDGQYVWLYQDGEFF